MLRILKASDLYIFNYKNHIPKPNTKLIINIFKVSMPMLLICQKSPYTPFAELKVVTDSLPLSLSPSIFAALNLSIWKTLMGNLPAPLVA